MICLSKTTASLWLILVSLLLPLPLQANGPARLYLKNVPLQDEQLLVVTVSLANVVDLYGAEIQLRYDPARLQVRDSNPRIEGVQIAPGPLLAYNDRFVVRNIVKTETGLINFAATLLNPAPAISGEGILATIPFEITGNGPFSVEALKAQLVSSNSEVLPVTTEDFYLDGAPEPVAAPQPVISNTSPRQWWGKVALGVGLFISLAFLLLRSKQAATIPADARTSSRKIPGAGRSSIRSSALLTQQGNYALNQGSMQRAYELFSLAIELDPANGEAWLGKGQVAQQEIEKRICFQRVLALNPDNTMARTELQQLEEHTKLP